MYLCWCISRRITEKHVSEPFDTKNLQKIYRKSTEKSTENPSIGIININTTHPIQGMQDVVRGHRWLRLLVLCIVISRSLSADGRERLRHEQEERTHLRVRAGRLRSLWR